jgi:hypothetical protein
MNTDTMTRLRSLAAAPDTKLTETERLRADAGLARILASDVAATPSTAALRRVRVTRWVAIPVAAAAAAAAFVVLPGLQQAPNAYASWTPEPDTLTDADRSVLDAACRSKDLDLVRPDLALAERRGDWVALLYLDRAPVEAPEMVATCVAFLPPGGDSAEDVSLARAGGGGFVPGPDEITEGAIFQSGGNRGTLWEPARPLMSLTHGLVGDGVAAVTIRLADGQAVEATVTDGTYVVWWPGEAFGTASLGGPSGEGGPEPSFTYDVTLEDGTVVIDSEPSRR